MHMAYGKSNSLYQFMVFEVVLLSIFPFDGILRNFTISRLDTWGNVRRTSRATKRNDHGVLMVTPSMYRC